MVFRLALYTWSLSVTLLIFSSRGYWSNDLASVSSRSEKRSKISALLRCQLFINITLGFGGFSSMRLEHKCDGAHSVCEKVASSYFLRRHANIGYLFNTCPN